MAVDLSPRVRPLARLLTFDVLRGNEAGRATQDLLRRSSLAGAKVVWPQTCLTVEAVPDLLLQAAGATTYDLVHGSLYDTMELLTHDRSFSTVKLVWTEAEERVYARFTDHQQTAGGYLPRIRRPTRRPPRPRGAGDTFRILALTNYLNGGPNDPERVFKLECYQQAFFESLSVAAGSWPGPLTVHWRPHPSDRRPRVEATARRHANLNMELSFGRDGLREELEWTDVVLTSMSSVIVEALDYSVPVLVHQTPFLDAAGVLALIAPARRFASPADLRDKLGSCLQALAEEAPDAFAYEAALEADLFGAGRTPRPLDELLWPAADSTLRSPFDRATTPP